MSDSQGDKGRTGTIGLDDEEAVKNVLVSTVYGLWEIVNNLTRLRPTRRDRYRVTIFGSARVQPGSFVYTEVKRVAAAHGGRGGGRSEMAEGRLPLAIDWVAVATTAV